MEPSDEKRVLEPDQARQAVKTGRVWKILGISVALAVIAMVIIGQI